MSQLNGNGNVTKKLRKKTIFFTKVKKEI